MYESCRSATGWGVISVYPIFTPIWEAAVVGGAVARPGNDGSHWLLVPPNLGEVLPTQLTVFVFKGRQPPHVDSRTPAQGPTDTMIPTI
jgi:hypothetical protein